MTCRYVHSVHAFTVCLLILLPASFAAAEPPKETLVDERKVDQYLFQVFQGEDENAFPLMKLVISGEGQTLFTAADAEVFFPEQVEQEVILDGVKSRFAMIEEYSGGAHCCLRLLLFHLEHPFHLYAHVFVGHRGGWEGELRSDGRSIVMDFPHRWFGYFYSSFADSWEEDIPLVLRPGRLEAVPGLLRAETWSAEEQEARLHAAARTVREQPMWPKPGVGRITDSMHVPTELCRQMLDVCRTGNADLARQLLERVWPGDTQSREEYWNGFLEELRASPLWDQLCDLNGWPGRGEGTFQRDNLLFPPNRWAEAR